MIVIGAGAAGMMAAAEASKRGARTCVLEKANKSGVKILMSGGTRCNVTHDCDTSGIAEAFGKNGRFLRQALDRFGPADIISLLKKRGVETKVESTGKVFPVSDRALDVCLALEKRMLDHGATLRLGTAVQNVLYSEGTFKVVLPQETLSCDRVIVTVGGMSYPGCGTTGDGYAWLKGFGHSIVSPRPALVPIVAGVEWTWNLQGLTLPDAHVTINKVGVKKKKGELATRIGSLLFTHFGFSGPAAMDVSRAIPEDDVSQIELRINALQDWNDDRFASWMHDKRSSSGNRQISTVLSEIVPRNLATALIASAQLDGETRVCEVNNRASTAICEGLLRTRVPIQGTRGFKKAEVTAGGVSLKEVDPRTMQSKLTSGLYVAGEILDLDGWIGGYNFQSAFSTGFVAGQSAADSILQQA